MSSNNKIYRTILESTWYNISLTDNSILRKCFRLKKIMQLLFNKQYTLIYIYIYIYIYILNEWL